MIDSRRSGFTCCVAALLAVVGLGCAHRRAEPPSASAPAPSTPPPITESAKVAEPESALDFTIDEAFASPDGAVAMGTLAAGIIEVGDALVVEGSDPPVVVQVRAVEAIRKPGVAPAVGDTVGLLLTLPVGLGVEALRIGARLVSAG